MSAFQRQGTGLPRSPQPAQPWPLCCSASGDVTVLYHPTPFKMSSVNQQRNHGYEIRDEAKNPQKCFLFLEEFPFHVAHFSARESRKPLACGQLWPQSDLSRTHPSFSSLLPRPGNSVRPSSAVSDSGPLGACPARLLSLSLNLGSGPRSSGFKFCLYLLLAVWPRASHFTCLSFLLCKVGITMNLRTKIINLCKILWITPNKVIAIYSCCCY